MRLKSYAMGKWYAGNGNAEDVLDAVSGEKIAEISSAGLDFKGMAEYGRNTGGPGLRSMTFHQRSSILKELAKFLLSKKEALYKLSVSTGATKADSWIDIDGGIGTFFTYASKGKRDLPDERFLIEGDPEQISKNGTFIGRHILAPLQGVAIHINAYNFPCWGMLEKLAPTFLAGMPAIVKPASVTAFLAEEIVRNIIDSHILPEGALQLICGGIGDLFDHLTCQDVVTFTGSASTGRKLRTHPVILENSVRFNMETDSLNYCILGQEAVPGTDEFNLFVKEVAKEMTVKAGQKCTAIRRAIVPLDLLNDVTRALRERLSNITIGNPLSEEVRMGPLVSHEQVKEVKERVAELSKIAEIVYGYSDEYKLIDADKEKGAFLEPILLRCNNPVNCTEPHDIEAFGPVSTIMPYTSVDEAIKIANMGKGSLVGSIFTADDDFAQKVVMGTSTFHGRLMIVNNKCAKESTGHGSPLPHLIHGGPGRAGGGEELGGILGIKFYMQRTALQGSPTTLTHICNEWMSGAERLFDNIHPFRKHFEDLRIGDSLLSHRRTVTEADIVNFAGVSGDFFYVHTDDIAARNSIFEKRVAHGYLILSMAAGLFVNPGPCPVLANYGLENLRFTKPVYAGDTIHVFLTCKKKTLKEKRENEVSAGIVEWNVTVLNQNDEEVAVYDILTLVKCKEN